MNVAEHLYTQGYISYPRTETTSYPANFDLKGVLQQQSNNPKWGDVVKKVLSEGINKPRSGEDKGDHPPITPMKPNNGQLSGGRSNLISSCMRCCSPQIGMKSKPSTESVVRLIGYSH
ncbi:hypothetical protein ANCCAN_25948 [Ancylostoma caninum]|uniref:DNA topoisomerase n=1 Tax=Ancylostoma caninum TaxID=29170 RepID=A0A368FBC7_ANCCA|nr:hypothetical protein ANCCAN_25948 [Ancylostoma caninum]